MADKFELDIKKALYEEANGISKSDDIFLRIKEKLAYDRQNENDFCNNRRFNNMNAKKIAVAVVCSIMVFAALTLGLSSNIRVFAEKAINNIKMFFIVENIDGKDKIIQKPSNEAYFTHSVSSTTTLSDEKLQKKLGFRVHFPQQLYGWYKLNNKALGVALGKELNYDSGRDLQSSMLKAITDDHEMEKLKEYKPSRNIFGVYKKIDGSMIFINALPLPSDNDIQSSNVKVNDLKGFWFEFTFPEYPIKKENGNTEPDMTVKPALKTTHTLSWQSEKVMYMLSTYKDLDLELEEAVKIAESFQKEQ